MEFYGTINSVEKVEGGIKIRLSQGFYIDERFEKPIRVITVKRCNEVPPELHQAIGEEIDGYEIDQAGITLWAVWNELEPELRIEATDVEVEEQPYSLDDYSKALKQAIEYRNELNKDILKLRRKLDFIQKQILHELDNLSRRCDFQPEKKGNYKKAISILEYLNKKIEEP